MADFSWSQGKSYTSSPHNKPSTREVIYDIWLDNDGGVTATYTCRLYARLDSESKAKLRDTATLTLSGSTGTGSKSLRYRIPSGSTDLIKESYFSVTLDDLFEPSGVKGTANFRP